VNKRLRKSLKGFLLFEVMVAVTIIGLGLAVLMQSISGSLAATRSAKDSLMAGLLLSEKLWEIQSLGSITPGIREGIFPDHPEYRYRVLVEDLFEPNPNLQDGSSALTTRSLNRVTLTLYWEYRSKTKRLQVETYMPSLLTEAKIS
jgi:type II secretory pathway pseudopilin PulG